MKSNSALRVVENNSHSSKDFTIQASGKMFHMVISGLYSNKPQSITREIWSNAYDAHAMVGKEAVPFEVTFPTVMTPTFTCRDFGPGIAHEDMEGFYTVLGHSTKENTNKAVGKWGVGRMSPMSYTDTFSVVSRHKGMIACYSVQLGPDGSPQLHVLAPPTPTDEPDGLEVSFPVKRFDVTSFQNAAEFVSYGFSVQPNVTNSQEKQFKPIKKVFEGDGYYFYEDSRMSGAYAQMGCVLYPIPSQYLPRTVNIVYQFDIGDLEVTASREALSFGPNDPTAANVKAKAAEVERQMWQKFQEEVDAQPKLFNAARLAPKLKQRVASGSKDFTYKGADIPRYWEFKKYTKLEMSSGYRGHRQSVAGWSLGSTVAVKEDYKVFIQDTSDKKANARAASRTFTRVDRHEYYLWIRVNRKDPVAVAELQELLSEIDYPVYNVADLPDSGPVRKTRSAVSVSRICNGGREPYAMDAAEFTKGGYYYPMKNNEYPKFLYEVGPLVKEALGMDNTILVPKTLWKNFEAAPQWKLLEPAIDALVAKEAEKVRKTFGNVYKRYPLAHLSCFAGMEGAVGDFARKVRDEVRSSTYMGVGSHVWAKMLSKCGIETFDNKLSDAEYNGLLDKYPLLKLYNNNYNKEFAQYIKLLDNAAKE
jgi:hypothetical protein